MPNDAAGYFRVPGWLRQQAGLGRIGRDARGPARTAYGLAIENVERGFLAETYVPSANYSLTSTTETQVDATNLGWDLWVSGKRPVALRFSMIAAAGAGAVRFSLWWDGVEVTGTTNGMAYTASTAVQQLTGVACLTAPTGGRHRLELVYRVDSGTSTVYGGAATNRVYVEAVEL